MGWSPQIHTGFHVPRTTQDTTIFLRFTYTGLSPSLVCLSKQFQFIVNRILQSYNPSIAVTILVWANPRSLATTSGIIIIFFSSGYLDVSVLRVYFLSDTISSIQWVAPFGNLRVNVCATNRSLSQLITSFIVSESLGIPHTLLFSLLYFCLFNEFLNYYNDQ